METLLKSIVAFIVLLFFTRILGKKQMNQITFFDTITAITLGSIAAEVSVDPQIKVWNGIIAFLVWACLAFMISILSKKSLHARNFFDGEPDILIKKGEIMQDAVARTHMNMDDLTMLLREKDIFSIAEVEYAILEPHGKLSVLKKPEACAPTKKDMSLPAPPPLSLPADLIVDGKVIRRNLAEIGRDERWLTAELAKHGLRDADIRGVFYMGAQEDGSTYVSMKNSDR